MQALAVGMGRGKPRLGNANPGLCLPGFQRLIRPQIIKPTTGVGLDIGERLVLLRQVVQRPSQQRVLLDIGQVPGCLLYTSRCV